MRKVCGYCRVSTSEQAINSYALEQQTQRLRDAGATVIYEDVVSGSSRKRPSFIGLCQAIKDGEVSEVVATRIDRIARSLLHLREFAELCIEHRVNLRVLDQNIDLSTPHGKLTFNMLGSVAEWELDLLRDRVQHGLRHMHAQSRAPGIIPFGYTKSADDRYAPDWSEYKETGKARWTIAREIIDTFLKVGTIRGTCREMEKVYGPRDPSLPKWHAGEFPRVVGLKYWLQNPVLRGSTGYYYRHRGRPVDARADTHEALIHPEEWEEIQRHLSIHQAKKRPDAEPMPLAGLVYCGKCGGKCKAYRHKGEIYRWYCAAKHTPTPTCKGSAGVRNDFLEDFAILCLSERGEQLALLAEEEPIEITDTPELTEAREFLSLLELAPNSPLSESAREQTRAKIAEMERVERDKVIVQRSLRTELAETTKDPQFWTFVQESGNLKRCFIKYVEKIVLKDGNAEISLRV